jgi:hypothetical protein
MALPSPWVDKIFEKLSLIFGQAFIRQWEGMDVGIVKADWADELGCFEKSPDSISYGLENVNPDRPPNVLQFKAICVKAPQYAPPALPRPKATEADRDRVRRMLSQVRDNITLGR